MKMTSVKTSNSVYLLQQTSTTSAGDCTYPYNLVSNGVDFLPTAKAFHSGTKMCKSEQDLLGGSIDTKVCQKTKNSFSTAPWFPFKEGTKITSIRNNQEVNNNKISSALINNTDDMKNRPGCRKRWKSETELRKISNSSNLFLGSLTEVVGEAKVSRYLKTSEALSELGFFTLGKVFSMLVTSVSVTYAAFFLYLLSQPRDPYTVANSLHWVFPSLTNDHSKEVLEDLEIGHCEFTVDNLAKKMDIFLLGHVLGYAGKMLLFRDFGFTWLISISWEFTEIFYAPVLPNFIECWWDIVLFDISICNAAGIFTGYLVLKGLGIEQLNWYQLNDSQTGENHHPQNSPPRWKPMLFQAWYVFILLFFCNNAELNSFTLKRVFGVNKNHPLNVIRLLIHAFMSYNVISGYRKVLREQIKPSELPVQFWLYLLAICLEFATVVKHGPLYTVSLLPSVACWISMLIVGSVLYVVLATFANFICYGTADCKTD